MIAANVIDKSEYPDFDEETGLLPKEDDSGEQNKTWWISYLQNVWYII